MTEIILSTPEYLNTPYEKMGFDTLQNIIKKAITRKHAHVYCHARLAHLDNSFEWLVKESKGRGFSLTLCLNTTEPMEQLSPIFSEDFSIEISLIPGSNLQSFSRLAEFEKVSFFLPLEKPTPYSEILHSALQIFPHPMKIRLGVGWAHRLSGPTRIFKDHHQLWAESLISLVGQISSQQVKIEIACGLKLCLFNRLQLGDLASKSIIWPIATCPKTFIFHPDGKMAICFRLDIPHAITRSHDKEFSQVGEEISRWSAPYSGLCDLSETLDCRSLRVKSCTAGCLEHILSEWSS